MNDEEHEDRGWYEAWLDECAGERVSTGPIFLGWVGLGVAVSLVAWAVGTELFADSHMIFFAAASGLYWFVAIPAWLRRRRDRRRSIDDGAP